MDAARARSLSQQRARELIQLLGDLVKAPSVAGTSGLAAQTVVARYLVGKGFDVVLDRDDPASWIGHDEFGGSAIVAEPPVNLIARPQRSAAGNFVMFAHVDTEPPVPAWRSNPWSLVVRGGRLFGLGAADDKAGVAAAAVAAGILADEAAPTPIVASVHGKRGGALGTLPVFARLPALRGALYVHPAETGRGLHDLKHQSRGVVDVGLLVSGWTAAPIEIGTPESAPFDSQGDALRACLETVDAIRRSLPDGRVNIGRLEAGEQPGTVPTRCRALLRVIFDEPHTCDSVVAAIRRVADTCSTARRSGDRAVRIDVTAEGRRANPACTPFDHHACSVVCTAVHDVAGVSPASHAAHLASDIRFPSRLWGAPAVGIGSLAGNFYGADEWVDLDDLVTLVAVLVVAMPRWVEAEAGQCSLPRSSARSPGAEP